MVPGVPTIMCAVTFVAFLGRLSLMAYSVCTLVNLPMATTTDMICRANSRDGARQRAYDSSNAMQQQSGQMTYLRLVHREIHTAKHCKNESSRFACTRLRLANHVRGSTINVIQSEQEERSVVWAHTDLRVAAAEHVLGSSMVLKSPCHRYP